tara:strand:- start:1090 stop:1302 length:213 start_codon:yes stop_codon:yes gene_type:complete
MIIVTKKRIKKMNIPSKRQVKRGKIKMVLPTGKNGKCIVVVKGNGAKPKPLTKEQVEKMRIRETLDRKVW